MNRVKSRRQRPETETDTVRWALVLSGGGSRGFAHIGVLRALEERGVPKPSFVAGASMGAIIGALYASGWPVKDIEAYARGFEIGNYLDNPAFRLPDISLSRLVQAGSALGALVRGHSIDSGAKAHAELDRLLRGARIQDFPVPFACTATDLVTGRTVVLDSGPAADAIRASMSFPAVFAPVVRDGMVLVDGGVLDNMPCDVARARGYRHVLASDVTPFEEARPARLSNGLSVLMRCYDIAAAAAQRPIEAQADLVIETRDNRSVLKFDGAAALVDTGYTNTRARSAELDAFFGRGHRFSFLAGLLRGKLGSR